MDLSLEAKFLQRVSICVISIHPSVHVYSIYLSSILLSIYLSIYLSNVQLNLYLETQEVKFLLVSESCLTQGKSFYFFHPGVDKKGR